MKLPRKLKKRIKKHATRMYYKPNLKKVRILNYDKATSDFEVMYV